MTERAESSLELTDSERRIQHVVFRVARLANVGSRQIDVIDAHNEVQSKHGAVAWAKFGHRLDPRKLRILASRVAGGQTATAYVVLKQSGEFLGYSSRIQQVLTADEPPPDKLVPPYYSHLDVLPAAWFVLGRPLKPTSLHGIRLASNERPLLDVISECMTAFFFVCSEGSGSRDG